MSTAFTAKERASITTALLAAARRAAGTTGLKKTTLDVLTQQCGISKSAFYAFFPSKEELFLQVYARWHQELFDQACAALTAARALSPRERAAQALEHTLLALGHSDLLANAQEDWPLLERKLPAQAIAAVTETDRLLVGELIARADVSLTIPLEDAVAIVRILLMSLHRRASIGAHFPRALSLLVRAACAQCISE